MGKGTAARGRGWFRCMKTTDLSYKGRAGELAVGGRERRAARRTKWECEGARVLVGSSFLAPGTQKPPRTGPDCNQQLTEHGVLKALVYISLEVGSMGSASLWGD